MNRPSIVRTSTAELYEAHVLKNYARAPLTLPRDRGSLREGVLLELRGKTLELRPLEACEQGHLAEGVDLDRHGRGS